MAVQACLHTASLGGIAVLGLALATPAAWAEEARSGTAPGTQPPAEPQELSLQELMNIKVTTVTRQESTVGHSAAAIFVITPEMIRRSGATTFPEVLRMVPGLEVARIDASKWAVSSRGFNDRFVGKQLVQVDGRSVYNAINAGVYWDTLNYLLQDVERIEVIRGPGASVWGANAVNGIINIITKPAKETPGGLLLAGSGTDERGFGGLRYGGKASDKLHYRVYGKGFVREKSSSPEGDPHDEWWAAQGGFRLDWQTAERDSKTLQGDYFHSVAGRADFRPKPVPPAPFFLTNLEDELSSGGNILFRWSRDLDKERGWMLQSYYDRFDRESTNRFFRFKIHAFDLDFQYRLPLSSRQKLIYGLGYRLNQILFVGTAGDNAFAIGPARVKRDTHLFSAFVQDEFALRPDRLYFTVGSKFEHNSFTGFEYQPTGRLLWTPSKERSVWFAVSRAVRTPSILDHDVEVGLLPTVTSTGETNFPRILPNADLESEALLAYELGYRAQPSDKLSFDITTFYNDYSSLGVVVAGARTAGPLPGTFILPLNRTNRMTGESFGAELSATWQPTRRWRLYGAYTFLRMQLHRDLGSPPISAAAEAPEGQSPRNQVYLQSSWDLPRNLELDLIVRYVDHLTGFSPPVGSYTSADVRLGWRNRNKNVEIAIVGQNLLDSHHPEFGSSPLLRSPRVELGRGVYGQVTWSF